ncbi:MAG: helix-turn-helix transcriptional regulator [Clostridia bacterium]|nr:helix-turn-helix transcriptional regulator [Clostridia bacterium]
MKDIKPIIAKNLGYFRREAGLTQAELAEKLNYSDKAISRWENGDTLPDINVLYFLCEFYGIDMTVLTSADAEATRPLPTPEENKRAARDSLAYRLCLYGLMAAVVWLVATIVFLYTKQWIAFIWALPVTSLALRYLWRGKTNTLFRFIVNTAFIWTLIVAVFLQYLLIGYNLWPLYLVGLPLQCMLILWYRIKQF